MMAQSENPRAARTAEGMAEKPGRDSDGGNGGPPSVAPQAAQLSRDETEENLRQVLTIQSAACELIISASRMPTDPRVLAAACAALAERALYVASNVERDPERREALQLFLQGIEMYQREVVFEMIR